MSGLAGVLAGHRAPGLYRWVSASEIADVRHVVEHSGWAFGALDGWTRADRGDVLAALGEALAFPAWYGANLDALADCLTDLAGPTVLLWDGWSVLARADPAAYAGVVDVLRERTAEEPAFAVLLRGDGPDVGAPLLE